MGYQRKRLQDFSLLDKCYFRIMKLLKFMKCPAIEASCNVGAAQVAWTSIFK